MGLKCTLKLFLLSFCVDYAFVRVKLLSRKIIFIPVLINWDVKSDWTVSCFKRTFVIYQTDVIEIFSYAVVNGGIYVLYSVDVPAFQNPLNNLCWRFTYGKLEIAQTCQVMI